MSHTAQFILDQVVLVKVEANIYGARKKLKKEDLILANGSKLPPEDLASLGSKRLLDPEQLSVFNRLKKEAERICLRVGTRFLGGYAIPCATLPGIMTELDRIAADFETAKLQFLAGYDQAVKDWVVRHPEFAGIIEQAVDSVEFVATRLSFDYLVVSVSMPDSLPKKELTRLESKIGSLSEQMFHEIAVDANLFIEQSLLGKDQVTRNALRPIQRMRDKLDGLGFLDYRVAPVVGTLDDLLQRVPSKGPIEGSLLQEILAAAMLLADSDKTRRHGAGLLNSNTERHTNSNNRHLDPSQLHQPSDNLTALTNADAESVVTTEPLKPRDPLASSVPSMSSPSAIDHLNGLFDGIFDDEHPHATHSLVTTEEDDEGEENQNPTTQDHWF